MKNALRFSLLFCLLTSCGGNKKSDSFNLVAEESELSSEFPDDDNRPRFWPRELLPLQLHYDQFARQFNSEDFDPFKEAMLQWETVIPEKLFFDFEDSTDFEGTAIQVSAFSSDYYEKLHPKALALTEYRVLLHKDYRLMDRARIIFNTDHQFRLNPPHLKLFREKLAPKVFDFQSVFLHEIGHLLGLNHLCPQDVPCNAVMKPQLAPLERAREVFADDISALRELYKKRDLLLRESPLPAMRETFIEEQALYSDGRCVHRRNGRIVETHRVPIKSF